MPPKKDCRTVCADAEILAECMDHCHGVNGVTELMPRASHLNTHASSGTDPICSSAVETIPTWCLIGWILSGFCLVTTLAWITVYFVMRIRSKQPRDAYNNNRPNAEDNVTQPLHLPVPNYMNGEQQQNIAAVEKHTIAVEGRGVVGVAINGSRIFFIQSTCDKISVYEACEPYNSLEPITVPGMINPSDVLAFDGCLYIPDNMTPSDECGTDSDSDHCIWKIPLLDEPMQPVKMLTSLGKWGPSSLSGTLDCTQIIITTKTKYVYFWSPDVTLQPTMVTLPPEFSTPKSYSRHIIELSYGLYLLCRFVPEDSGCRLSQVCRLVRNGDKMSFIDNPSDKDNLNLNDPRHLAELSDGRILVVDHSKDRVLVLTKYLQLCTELLRPHHGVKKRPYRIAYDSGSSMLLVAFHHYAGLYLLEC